jgi:hypothetical protein
MSIKDDGTVLMFFVATGSTNVNPEVLFSGSWVVA